MKATTSTWPSQWAGVMITPVPSAPKDSQTIVNMWKILAVALCFFFCGVLGYVDQELKRNPLETDVKNITHNQADRLLTIHLHEDRQCRRPVFRVRLSGTSLYILDLVKHQQHNATGTYHFTYPPLQDAGTYYLEVIVFLCEHVNKNAFSHMCLIDPQDGENVVTLPFSDSNFFVVPKSEVSPLHRPRWVLPKSSVNAVLPTRYQRNNCPNGFCRQQPQDIEQHNRYVWTDKPAYTHLLAQALQLSLRQLNTTTSKTPTGHETITFCMIGASHSRELTKQGNALSLKQVNFVHVLSQYPFLFDEQRSLQDCSYAIIGYGEWPLSYLSNGHPYTAQQYEDSFLEVFKRLKRAKSDVQVFTRSVNTNALCGYYTSCPIIDFRTPPFVDVYNKVLKNVSTAHNIKYIDTTHVQGPLWDSALDWSHCPPQVYTAEIETILHHVLSYSHKHQRPPPIALNVNPRGARNVLVQFSDAETVYLYAGEVMRAFDMTTFRFFDYAGSDILLYNANRRSEFVFGPPLHGLAWRWR